MTMWASRIFLTPCPRLLICTHPTIPRIAPMVISTAATNCTARICKILPRSKQLQARSRAIKKIPR